jgi:hypothetical protein
VRAHLRRWIQRWLFGELVWPCKYCGAVTTNSHGPHNCPAWIVGAVKSHRGELDRLWEYSRSLERQLGSLELKYLGLIGDHK